MERIVLVGGSVRALAQAARAAGFAPVAVDRYGDRDLHEVAEVRPWPDDWEPLFREFAAVPWVYGGGMENRWRWVDRAAKAVPLWGVSGAALRAVRNPWRLARVWAAASLAAPAVWPPSPPPGGEGPGERGGIPRANALPSEAYRSPSMQRGMPPLSPGPSPPGGGEGGQTAGFGRLQKSYRSTGGLGVGPNAPGRCYLQQRLSGDSRSGLFCADGTRAHLIGVTAQLVGKAWCRAGPFRYCGSVGLLPIKDDEREHWHRIGDVLQYVGLRGLFGVDAIVRLRVPQPVEVNPRYTAAFEVWGRGNAIALQSAAFRGKELLIPEPPRRVFGKAVLFADRSFRFPAGDWTDCADVPFPGTLIPAGGPILTIRRNGSTRGNVVRRLRRKAEAIYSVVDALPPAEDV